MIIVKIKGGLGNQMFQYALGRHLALKNDEELLLHISPYKGDIIREFLLGGFQIKAKIASDEELKQINIDNDKFIDKIKNSFSRKNYLKMRYINEKRKWVFDPDILKLTGNIYLDGYWQNEKYFFDIRDMIVKDFTLKKTLNHEIVRKLRQNKENSVALHFRRTDYVENPVTNRYHGVCSLDYYYNAIMIISKHIENPKYFIFSDDIEWVKNNLKLEYDHIFIDFKPYLTDIDELDIMKMCGNHIIANSTFSWWGAWLSEKKEKMVIAPKKWLKNTSNDTSELIPEKWIEI